MKLRIKEENGQYWLQEKVGLFWFNCERTTEYIGLNRFYNIAVGYSDSPAVPTLEEATQWASEWREAYDKRHKKRVEYYRA